MSMYQRWHQTMNQWFLLLVSVPNNETGRPSHPFAGSFAKGDVDVDYADDSISFSEYPLSGALACAKVTNAFEKHWGVLWMKWAQTTQ